MEDEPRDTSPVESDAASDEGREAVDGAEFPEIIPDAGLDDTETGSLPEILDDD